MDSCSAKPCKNGATCEPAGATFSCQCAVGYTGRYCENDIDECQPSNPCYNGGTCVNEEGAYSCQCSDGFTGKHCDLGKND
ncbi:predicted protein [Nematostella vectensis]|uniref:EGF-like domain-containing protein n=1 Tax=Nematostella vectensis TaxID=45351 RepID=A8DVR5_NEMVE|nr:predicted protein [Nematostella vectensis]|eukprot:XP_001617794.1 hypothetical protein NEMVEDRAFT_v1g156687 [Nematostella vectensis]